MMNPSQTVRGTQGFAAARMLIQLTDAKLPHTRVLRTIAKLTAARHHVSAECRQGCSSHSWSCSSCCAQHLAVLLPAN